MAAVYFSYRTSDRQLFQELSERLAARGHDIRSDKGIRIGDSWRDVLAAELVASDAVVLLWSDDTWHSQYVAAEVGAARAADGVALLPVLVRTGRVPPFIQDLMVEHIDDLDAAAVDALADKLDRAIATHLERRNRHKKGAPKVFVSHRHKDEDIVAELVRCLTLCFVVGPDDIRCTSVSPYRLRVGENTANRLRDEIASAEVVLGVLSTDTLRSSYVAFELGAAWGRAVWTCPLLVRGATYAHIPDPIRGLSPLSLSDTDDCNQLLDDLGRGTTLTHQPEVSRAELSNQVNRLTKKAATQIDEPSP